MTWHVIARAGTTDSYDPELPDTEPRIRVAIQRPGDPDSLGPDPLAEIHLGTGSIPTAGAADMLALAMAAYAADLRIPRAIDRDRWTRDITLHLPVMDPKRWETVRADVTRLLSFLTGDRWEILIRQRLAYATVAAEPKLAAVKTLSLFSGGLDSLIGAVDLLSAGEPVMLVGHYGAGMTNPVQQQLLEKLQARYGESVHRLMFYVQPPKNYETGEPTMRSRSILFLALGIATASALGDGRKLVVGENGPISINVPLTMARVGSLSTRTTHPHTIGLFSKIVAALGLSVAIEMPYRFQTKGEMLRGSRDKVTLTETAPLTMSCSHPEIGRYAGLTPGNHCGYCVPCIIRRAALNAAGMAQDVCDTDILVKPPASGTGKGSDLHAFRMAITRFRGATRREHAAWVAATGPIPPADISAHVETYVRGMNEVAALLDPQSP